MQDNVFEDALTRISSGSDEPFERLIDLIAEQSGIPRGYVKEMVEERFEPIEARLEQLIDDFAKHVGSTVKQSAVFKAEQKRRRKALALQRQQGVA